MPRASHSWDSDWTVRVRVWVERAGQAVLGKGRLELLEAIDRWHSISEAARQMGMSYRRAWLLVQSINEAAGKSLVTSATGGRRGGGAQLTPLGQSAVKVFREVQERIRRTAAVALPALVRGPAAASVHVAAAVSLEEVLGQVLTDYALHRPAVRVRAVFGASDELADHLLAGAPGDLFLTADPQQLDRLQAAGLLRKGSRTPLAENRLAAVGPADRPPVVRRPSDLGRAGPWRVALADPAAPLGGYSRAYLNRLGVYERVAAGAVWVDNSRAVLAAVRAGRADVGLAYASDAAQAAGCRLLFRARQGPDTIRYSAGLLSRGASPEKAQELLAFLTSPVAAERFRRCGFLLVRS
jgi:molybdate transport system substrate-binding protein